MLKVVGEIMDQLRTVWKLTNSECAIMEITVDGRGFHAAAIACAP